MQTPSESPELRIKVYWNPPPTHLYHVGDREAMDATLETLRREVLLSIEQDSTLGSLKPDQLSVETGWIGPQAQTIDTIDIVLKNLSPDFLQQIQDLVDNLRHGFVESPIRSIQRLFSLKSEYFGVELNATVLFEHELWSQFQPTIMQDLNAPLLTFSAPYPEHLETGSPEWASWIEASNRIGEDFRVGVASYLTELYDLDINQTAIEVKSVIQPPMSGPLIDTFFVDVSYIISALAPLIGQAAAERAVGRVLGAGLKRVKDRWPGNFPDDKELEVAGNRNELLRRVKLHMASEGYSGIDDDCYAVSAHNRRIQSGYHMPIDQNSPMGWIVRVSHHDGVWEFKILDNPKKVERKTFSKTGDQIAISFVDLMRDHGELYDPDIPQ